MNNLLKAKVNQKIKKVVQSRYITERKCLEIEMIWKFDIVCFGYR